MEIRLLGPVDVWLDGRSVELGPRQQRLVLALLALEPGRLVTIERMIDLLWPTGRTPRSARNTVQVRVFGLRSQLGERLPIRTGAGGYLLDVDADRIDVHRFGALTEQARAASDRAERVRLYRAALGLWRGPALTGVSADEAVRERLVTELEENRLLAYEELFENELELGNGGQILAELVELATAHPDRERLIRLRMSALARIGETGRALEVARTHRERLVDELGLDPSPAFQELELAILRNQVPPDPRDASEADTAESLTDNAKPFVPVPAQLPAAVAGFTGRAHQLLELDLLLPEPHARQSQVGVISGTAGVGKTALAVHWARHRTANFADGQLYLDLRGHAEQPAVRPIDALGMLLRGLGVPAEAVPGAVDEASALFRTTLAGKRVLLLLDNAASADQVRPLLPAEPGCLALVTSRNRLSGLVAKQGATRLLLDPLAPDDATELLTNLLGPVRATAEPDGVAVLVEVCDRLPLAIRILAAQLTDEPHQSLSAYATMMRDRPMDALALEGDEQSAVAATFDLSYRRLGRAEQRLFRLLGLVPGPDFDAYAAAALTGATVDDTRTGLRRLAMASLLGEPAAGRYRFHDLIRHYADAKARDEEPPESRQSALGRLLAWYHQTAVTAAGHLYPSALRIEADSVPDRLPRLNILDERAALAWFEAEQPNLQAAVESDLVGLDHWRCYIANAQRHYVDDRCPSPVRRANAAGAVRAAERLGDDRLLADAYLERGYVEAASDRRAAINDYKRALKYAERCDDRQRVASLLHNIGVCQFDVGDFDASKEYLTRAAEAKQEFAGPDSIAATLHGLAKLDLLAGRLPEALARCEQARALGGSAYRRALTLENQAELLLQLGRHRDALEVCAEAEAVAHSVGRRTTIGHVLALRARIVSALGELDQALEDATEAVRLAEELSNAELLGAALAALAETHAHRGEFDVARQSYQRALQVCESASLRSEEARIRYGLAELELGLGRYSPALARANDAVAFAQEYGLVLYEERARALVTRAAFGLTG